MFLNKKTKPFLVFILLLNEKRLCFLNCDDSYKKWVYIHTHTHIQTPTHTDTTFIINAVAFFAFFKIMLVD